MVDHLDDLAADFLRFYRIWIDPEEGEWGGLTGPQFLKLAWRVVAYPGVIQALAQVERQESQQSEQPRRVAPRPDQLGDIVDDPAFGAVGGQGSLFERVGGP